MTITPRDWHELYPTQIDGMPTQSYYHWLALAYASTLAGHPAISIPGRARQGRDALRPADRRAAGDDLGVLAVAAELEALFAGMPKCARSGPTSLRWRRHRRSGRPKGFSALPDGVSNRLRRPAGGRVQMISISASQPAAQVFTIEPVAPASRSEARQTE